MATIRNRNRQVYSPDRGIEDSLPSRRTCHRSSMSCRRPTPFVPPPGCRAGSLSPSSTNIRVERLAPFARNSRASLRVTNDPTTVEPSTTTNLRATDLFIGRAQNFFSLDRFQRGAAPPWGQPHRAPYNHICKPLRTSLSQMIILTGAAGMPFACMILSSPRVETRGYHHSLAPRSTGGWTFYRAS